MFQMEPYLVNYNTNNTLFESQIYHQMWSAYDYSNNKINRI